MSNAQKQAFVDYLPEIYRQQPGFVAAYLDIFQTLYEDFERRIETSASLYDADSAPDEFLSWLCGWLAVKDLPLWPRHKLRELLRHAHRLNRMRGTLEGIQAIVSLYCGGQVFQVETYHAMRYYALRGGEAFKRLYGGDRNSFFILPDKPLNGRDAQAVRHLLDENKPAHVTARVVTLAPRLVLDGYTYLGINSNLSAYAQARLDGQSGLNLAVL